jgi:NADH:ubiquinone oxidoreductase subunit F (NADH-binding)
MKNKNNDQEIKHYIEVDRYEGTVRILDLTDEDEVENLEYFKENGKKSVGEGGYITWDGEESMIIQVPA